MAKDLRKYIDENGVCVIPEGIRRIPDNTFMNCINLTNIRIPESVKDIGYGAFHNCGALKSVMFPDSVIKIGELAFSCCSNLESITIPASIKEINYGAFHDCPSLTDVYYKGTREQWYKAIDGTDGSDFIKVRIHCTDDKIPLLKQIARAESSANAQSQSIQKKDFNIAR